MPVLRSINRHPAGQPASRAPAKPGSGQRGSAAPALRTIGGLRSDFHPVLVKIVYHKTRTCVRISVLILAGRGGVSSSALLSEASCIPGRGSTRQGVV